MNFKEMEKKEIHIKQHCQCCSELLIACTCTINENGVSQTPEAVTAGATETKAQVTSQTNTAGASEHPPGSDIQGIHGKYKLDELIGEGGSSRVFKSMHEELGKAFAVKILRSEVKSNDRALKRFNQEMSASSQLTHPGLCQIFEHGVTDDGAPYLVMEHLDGEDLRHTIDRDGPLDPRRVIDLFVELCDAVAHAHYKGVIHRDLKPSNIIVTKKDGVDTVKIVDFGVAKLMPEQCIAEGNVLTQTGEVFGSPLYMSPEQCTGKSIDARADIYSLGCCMFECLTGKPPHQGDNPVQTILKQISDAPKPFDSSLAVPSGLQKIVMTALQKDPDKRYQSAQDMYRDLILVRDNKPPRGGKCAKKVNLADKLKRYKKAAVASLVALVCVSIPLSILLNDSSFRGRLDSAWQAANKSKPAEQEPWSKTLHEAKVLASYGHNDEADPLFQKALEQAKAAKVGKRPWLARVNVLNTYGDFLIDSAQKGKGTWDQARKCFSESRAICMLANPVPPEHQCERLGMIDYQLKDYAKAEEDYARAREDFEGEFKRKDGSVGKNYPLSDRSNQIELGTLLIGQGNTFMKELKYSQARSAYLRASEIMTAPDDRVLVAEALQGLAQSYEQEGNYAQSDKAYKRAQDVLSNVAHAFAKPDLISILNGRIHVLQKLGHKLQAAEVEKQLDAVKIANNPI